MSSTEEIVKRINELLQPLLESQGVELVETVLLRPRRGRSTLRIFLDRPGGINLDGLTRISRVAGELLEVHDLIPEAYHLEVSSPGLTRELKQVADYRRYAGRLVRLTTRAPWEGRQVHRGILQGLEDGEVYLKEGGTLLRIPLKEIARARLEIDWKNFTKEG
jgi:ribosome maturation factor RimP